MFIAYFNSLVTPGLGAAGHIRRFSKRLIREDLPTFGYPTIPALTCNRLKNFFEVIQKLNATFETGEGKEESMKFFKKI